jgi:hypothetical protein
MKFYNETEVKEIINELSAAAEEAIEKAAGEAAKAAVLASLERELSAVSEAQRWQGKYQDTKRKGVTTAVIAGVICLFGGIAVGSFAIR